MTAAPLIEVEELVFQRARAAGGFELCVPSLTLRAGQRLALVGPSGCGKSTVLDLLSLILQPSSVTRFLFRPEADRVVDLAPASLIGDLDRFATLRRTSIGYVLQQGGLLSFLSIFDNIRLGNSRLRRSAVERLARRLEIEHLLDQRPRRLSAGERQRVAVARAIVNRPALVLADEPTGALDPPAAQRVMTLMIELAESSGAGLIVASHDRPLIERLGFERISPRIEEGRHGARSVFG